MTELQLGQTIRVSPHEQYEIAWISEDMDTVRLRDAAMQSTHDVEHSQLEEDLESGEVEIVSRQYVSDHEVVVNRTALATLADHASPSQSMITEDDIVDALEQAYDALDHDWERP